MMRQSLSLDDRVVHSACGWLPDSWLPEAGIRRALRGIAAMPGAPLLQYGHPLGYLPLRQQIRLRLAELDIAASPEAILLTDGASQAIDLVCRHLLQPGDAVLVDDPGYFQLPRRAAGASGAGGAGAGDARRHRSRRAGAARGGGAAEALSHQPAPAEFRPGCASRRVRRIGC